MRSRHVLLACSFPFKEGPLNPGLHSEWIKFSGVSRAHMSEIHLCITRRRRGFSPRITPAARRPLFSGKPGYMINILSLPGSAFPGFKSAWMLDFLKMYLSPHPASWGGIASRRQSHWGQNKSWQIFKLLLQSPGFSFISISGATYLPCWPSFLKGRENSFNRALYLFLLKCRLEIHRSECSQLSSERNLPGFPMLSGAPPSSPAQLSGETEFLPFPSSLLLSRKHGSSLPHMASCIHLMGGCIQSPYSKAPLLKKQREPQAQRQEGLAVYPRIWDSSAYTQIQIWYKFLSESMSSDHIKLQCLYLPN